MINSKSRSTSQEKNYKMEMESHLQQIINQNERSISAIVNDFAKYASRQQITRFLAHNQIFNEIIDVPGSIIECGVYTGQGLMTWAQLSSIYEPIGGVTREIFGFDTFTGFPDVHKKDLLNSAKIQHDVGDLATNAYDDLLNSISLYDKNRFLSQFPKIHLIKGNFLETADYFFVDYPHVFPALLYLDFDLYEPTKKALEIFLPRMCKGSVVAFDELNDATWPGETLAVLETMDIRSARFKKVGYDIKISYAILE